MKHVTCNIKNRTSWRSFSLIELVIVIGVIGISLPVIFGLFFIALQQQSKIFILQEIKRNGDYALNTMQSTIKQYAQKVTMSDYITEICPILPNPTPALGSTIYFVDKFGNYFKYSKTSTSPSKIASDSPSLVISNWYLTNDRVKIDLLEFTCYKTNAFSPPIVVVLFTVSQTGTPARYEEKASMTYQTKIKLKSY
jgi:type II secretory pathway pseudopilin PulG